MSAGVLTNPELPSDPSDCSGPFCCGNNVVALLEPGPIRAASFSPVRLVSWLPGLPVLAFLVRNVFVAAVVPKMAAGCSPEVTLVSVHRPAPPWSEGQKRDRIPNRSPTECSGSV